MATNAVRASSAEADTTPADGADRDAFRRARARLEVAGQESAATREAVARCGE